MNVHFWIDCVGWPNRKRNERRKKKRKKKKRRIAKDTVKKGFDIFLSHSLAFKGNVGATIRCNEIVVNTGVYAKASIELQWDLFISHEPLWQRILNVMNALHHINRNRAANIWSIRITNESVRNESAAADINAITRKKCNKRMCVQSQSEVHDFRRKTLNERV